MPEIQGIIYNVLLRSAEILCALLLTCDLTYRSMPPSNPWLIVYTTGVLADRVLFRLVTTQRHTSDSFYCNKKRMHEMTGQKTQKPP